MRLFQNLDYDAWYALGELVDNAVSSYRTNKEALEANSPGYQFRVTVDVDGAAKRMEVRDNAAGIASADFERALIAGEQPTDMGELNQFGMGMKSACCWWADKWTLTTSALGEPVQRSVTFDIPRIVAEQIEEVEVQVTNAPPEQCFTELVMENMTKGLTGQRLGKTRRHLASIYRRLLESGALELEVQGELLSYSPPKPLTAAFVGQGADSNEQIEWKRPLNFVVDGKQVSGEAIIRETGSTTENGLAIFWRDRLIKGIGESPYRPPEIYGAGNKFRSQRLSIEVDLNEFQPNNTKVNIVWPDDAEDAFLKALKASLDTPPSFVYQAENFRKSQRPDEKEAIQVAERSVQNAVEPVEDMGADIEAASEQTVDLVGDDVAEALDRELPATFSEERTVVIHNNTWTIKVELFNGDGSKWLRVFADPQVSDRKLVLRIDRAAPFAINFGTLSVDQLEPQVRLAIGIAVAQTIARDQGFAEAPIVLENLNSLLHEQLAEPNSPE